MMRTARLAILIVCAALQPSGTRRYPLALISLGTPRDAAERAGMSPLKNQ